MTFFLQEEAQSSNHHYEIFSYEKRMMESLDFLALNQTTLKHHFSVEN